MQDSPPLRWHRRNGYQRGCRGLKTLMQINAAQTLSQRPGAKMGAERPRAMSVVAPKEMTMNMNPWYVDNAAQYERQRIRAEMKQIRLEESAKRAQPKLGRLMLRVWHLLFKERVKAIKQSVEV